MAAERPALAAETLAGLLQEELGARDVVFVVAGL